MEKNKNQITHNLDESYLQSLTEEERQRQMGEWNVYEWEKYLCPNGTMTLEEFERELNKVVDATILRKYGPDYID